MPGGLIVAGMNTASKFAACMVVPPVKSQIAITGDSIDSG